MDSITDNRLKFNIHELQRDYGTPFDNERISISGVLKYYFSIYGSSNLNSYKERIIDPEKIKYIENHYQKNISDRIWKNVLYKERCQPSSGNIKQLAENPFYYFNGDINKEDSSLRYIEYKGMYYLLGDGNHRTVIAKYFWYFNKKQLIQLGFSGIKAKCWSISDINIGELSAFRSIKKRNPIFILKNFNSLKLIKSGNSNEIVLNNIDTQGKSIPYPIKNILEFKKALKFKYILRNFKKQCYYFIVFNYMFRNYKKIAFKKFILNRANYFKKYF